MGCFIPQRKYLFNSFIYQVATVFTVIDERGHCGGQDGWRFRGLPWVQD